MLERSKSAEFGVTSEDWKVVTNGRVNVLLIGPEVTTSQVLDAMLPTLSQPIARWPSPGDAAAARPCGTLLVQGADRLTAEDQQRLYDWLAGALQPQVVSIARLPLFPLVEQGKFLSSLYYRLNVVSLTFEPSTV